MIGTVHALEAARWAGFLDDATLIANAKRKLAEAPRYTVEVTDQATGRSVSVRQAHGDDVPVAAAQCRNTLRRQTPAGGYRVGHSTS